MQFIKISDIQISPDRQRRTFNEDKLLELQSSIERNGLFNAVVLRDGNVLATGERRLKCLENLHMLDAEIRYNGQVVPAGYAPVTFVGELTEIQAMEVELEENVAREDLTWQDHSAAVRKLHELRDLQKKEIGEVQTVAATAEEVTGRSDGYYHDKTRKELAVAAHLDNPEVAKAKSVEEAYKVLQKQEIKAKAAAGAEAMGKVAITDKLQVYHASCLSWIRDYSGEKFDVICTDPPYGMGAQSFGDAGGRLSASDHQYDDSPEAFEVLMEQFIPLSFGVTKPQAHMYLMCDIDKFPWLKALCQKVGWYVFRTPLINYKLDANRVPLPDKGPRRQYEIILYAIKGDRLVTGIYSDVISTRSDADTAHGAQKPVELYTNLLKRSAMPGDLVVDFFAGSGPILPAANELSLRAIAVEQDQTAYGYCIERLKSLEE
jgi:site-specific DNA-methyltransferase (adenine-specific)